MVAMFEAHSVPASGPTAGSQSARTGAESPPKPVAARASATSKAAKFFEARDQRRCTEESSARGSVDSQQVAMAALEATARLPEDAPARQQAIWQARDAGIFLYRVRRTQQAWQRLQELLEEEQCDACSIERAIERDQEYISQEALARARQALRAVLTREAGQRLEQALAQGGSAGIEAVIKRDQEYFSQEALSRARETLKARQTEEAGQRLERALEQGGAAGLEKVIACDQEYLGQEALARARQALATLQLAAATQQVAKTPRKSLIDSLRRRVAEGGASGLAQESLAGAVDMLSWAEENMEVCDICCDADRDAQAMPCCGRGLGGGRICGACLRNCKARRTPCPFCRTAIS